MAGELLRQFVSSEPDKEPEDKAKFKESLDSFTKKEYDPKFLKKLEKEKPKLYKSLSEMMKEPENQDYRTLRRL